MTDRYPRKEETFGRGMAIRCGMKVVVWLALVVLGCADEMSVPVDEPEPVCCTLLPDIDAAKACVQDLAPEGTCGVYICWDQDVRINFCG